MYYKDENIIEPLKYYLEKIQPNFKKELINFFEQLVKESNIDVENNKKLTKEYEELDYKKNKLNKKLSAYKSILSFIKWGMILLLFYIIFIVYSNFDNFWNKNIIIPTSIYIIIEIIMFFVIKKFLSPKIKDFSGIYKKIEEDCEKKLLECKVSMKSLNDLMDSKYTHYLINKFVPFIKIDSYFDINRYNELVNNYGMEDESNSFISTNEAVSGEILGNPFLMLYEKIKEIKDETYVGTKIIYWTEYYEDSEGKMQSRTVSETLRAYVTKPKPYYSYRIKFILANDVCSNLKFSRTYSHIERKTEKELSKYIMNREKKLLDKEKNSNYIKMSNTDFEVLFNALDRNDEKEFRLLFTPLAQKNIIDLLKYKYSGDNFEFLKNKKINIIYPENNIDDIKNIIISKDKYISPFYEKCRENFIKFNIDYVNKIFFTVAPAISIPLYQQYVSKEKIYNDNVYKNKNYNGFISEILANNLFENKNAILKTSTIDKRGETDLVKISYNTYKINKQVTYVSVYGGDGYYHDVPVYWDEYIPNVFYYNMEIKRLGIDDKKCYDIMSKENIIQNSIYKDKFFAIKLKDEKIIYENLWNTILKK